MNKMYLFGAIVVILVVLGLYSTGVLQNVLPPGVYICDQRNVDMVVVTDLSNSMDDNCFCADGTPSSNGYCTTNQGYPYHPNLPCNINRMKEATKSLVSNMLSNDYNRVGLVAYSTKTISSADLTDDANALLAGIDHYETNSMTCIGCGMKQGINILRMGQNEKKVMVLMTDGEANRCVPGITCTVQEAENEAIGLAAQAFADYGIETYTVAYDIDSETVALQRIAVEGHGQYFEATADSIYSIYAEIAEIVTCESCSEDGICDPGENCQRCPSDCIPPGGSVCCNGVITPVDCSIDANCDDGDPCTDDVCNTAVCAGTCSNTLKPGYKYDAFGVCHPPCVDGTEYGQCSASQPGYYCN
jgi:von Willebrand factor type A domain-containing protein